MTQRHLDRSWHREQSVPRCRVLAVMHLARSATCAVAGWLNPYPGAPQGFYRVACIASLVVGILLWQFCRQIPLAVQHLLLALYSLMLGTFAAVATRDVTVMALGPAVIAVAAYAGYFNSGRTFYLQAGWALIAFALGTAISVVSVPLVGMTTALLTAAAMAIVLHTLTQQLRRGNTLDNLTGVANRAAWTVIATRTLLDPTPTAVAIVDMDDFKTINDTAGHLAGDELLQSVTRAWREILPTTALIGRFGGDEFVVLFPDTRLSAAHGHLAQMADAHPARWTAGVSTGETGEPLAAILARADAELLTLKRSSR